jgi:hypothetical protein
VRYYDAARSYGEAEAFLGWVDGCVERTGGLIASGWACIDGR